MAKKEDKQIRNLMDLCDYFGAESPEDLNSTIYRATACGASLSIYSGHPGHEEKQSWDFRVSRRYAGTAAERFSVNVRRPDRKSRAYIPIAHRSVPEEIRQYFLIKEGTSEIDREQLDMSWEEWMAMASDRSQMWRRWGPLPFGETVGSDRYGTLTLRCRVDYVLGRAWHNGDDWSEVDPEEITGFTIQSIVEGSEVTVDSNLFEFPVIEAEVDQWMKDMDEITSFYWERDNSENYRLFFKDEVRAYVRSTWGKISWFEAEDVPELVKKAVEKIVCNPPRVEDCQGYPIYDLGDGWKMEEYCDDSDY